MGALGCLSLLFTLVSLHFMEPITLLIIGYSQLRSLLDSISLGNLSKQTKHQNHKETIFKVMMEKKHEEDKKMET